MKHNGTVPALNKSTSISSLPSAIRYLAMIMGLMLGNGIASVFLMGLLSNYAGIGSSSQPSYLGDLSRIVVPFFLVFGLTLAGDFYVLILTLRRRVSSREALYTVIPTLGLCIILGLFMPVIALTVLVLLLAKPGFDYIKVVLSSDKATKPLDVASSSSDHPIASIDPKTHK